MLDQQNLGEVPIPGFHGTWLLWVGGRGSLLLQGPEGGCNLAQTTTTPTNLPFITFLHLFTISTAFIKIQPNYWTIVS